MRELPPVYQPDPPTIDEEADAAAERVPTEDLRNELAAAWARLARVNAAARSLLISVERHLPSEVALPHAALEWKDTHRNAVALYRAMQMQPHSLRGVPLPMPPA